ncbi:MAG: sigma-70 family RNA polymerase sigma factor [Verrucomicrobiota bacterium]
MPTEHLQQARWFEEEVHPHGPDLRSYLRRSFPAVRDVDDVVQESYLRVWTACAAQPIRCARGFLFKVARHLALDLVRRDRASPLAAVRDFDALSVVEEKAHAVDVLSTREKIQLVASAVATLPARCREIIVLRKFHGLSQREVAQRLGLSERTVEVQVSRGVKRCEQFLRARGIHNLFDDV